MPVPTKTTTAQVASPEGRHPIDTLVTVSQVTGLTVIVGGIILAVVMNPELKD